MIKNKTTATTAYILIGPDQVMTNKLLLNNDLFTVYDTGKKEHINCKELTLEKNSNLVIFALGAKGSHPHYIKMCRDNYVTHEVIQLLSKGESIQIELFSSYSQSAAHAIKLLPKESTLMTFTPSNFNTIMDIDYEVFLISTKLKNYHNPFIKFANYIFTYPNSIKFSINNDGEFKHFSYDINEILEHLDSHSKIINWQEKTLYTFVNFCNEIKIYVGDERLKQINEFLSLYENNKINCTNLPCDITRYKELLLIKMVDENNITMINKLLETNIDINATTIPKHATPLFIASLTDNVKMIEILNKAGADMEKSDHQGYTPLLRATEENNINSVKILLSLGAHVDAKLEDGRTSLIIASYKGFYVIVEELIGNGASVNAKIHDHNASSLYLSSMSGYANIVELLIASGASVNEKGVDNYTPLEIAIQQNHIDVIKIFDKYQELLEYNIIHEEL